MRKQVEKSVVLYNYETENDINSIFLSETLRIYYGKTRRETVQFAARTLGTKILYPFDNALVGSNGLFTPCSSILE